MGFIFEIVILKLHKKVQDIELPEVVEIAKSKS